MSDELSENGGESEGVLKDERARRYTAPSHDSSDAREHHIDFHGHGEHLSSSGSQHGGKHHRHRHRRTRNHRRGSSNVYEHSTNNGDKVQLDDVGESSEAAKKKTLAPGARIQFLLAEDDGENDGEGRDGEHEEHPIFTEMAELHDDEWKETARWVKFEEDVEEGGNRWSKPHVSTLSLHSLFELRSFLMSCCVILELDGQNLPDIVDIIMDKMVSCHELDFQHKEEVREAILRRHTHQYEQHHRGGRQHHHGIGVGGSHHSDHQSSAFVKTVRSLADIGKSFSHGKNMHHEDHHNNDFKSMAMRKVSTPVGPTTDLASQSHLKRKISTPIGPSLSPSHGILPKISSIPKDISRTDSQTDTYSKAPPPLHVDDGENEPLLNPREQEKQPMTALKYNVSSPHLLSYNNNNKNSSGTTTPKAGGHYDARKRAASHQHQHHLTLMSDVVHKMSTTLSRAGSSGNHMSKEDLLVHPVRSVSPLSLVC